MRKRDRKIRRLQGVLLWTLLLGSLVGCAGTGGRADSARGIPAGSLHLAGSSSMEKMTDALAERFMEHYPEVTVTVAAVVSLSIVLIIMFAKVVGSTLPIAAEKIGVDPAVMANPLISTITDAVSLLIYFEIAKAILGF